MGYIGVIAHLLTIDPNFQRDIQFQCSSRLPLKSIHQQGEKTMEKLPQKFFRRRKKFLEKIKF